MEDYIPRIIDEELQLRLDTFGAVLLRGPKWCGKTTTASNKSASSIKMQDPKKSKDYIAAADTEGRTGYMWFLSDASVLEMPDGGPLYWAHI